MVPAGPVVAFDVGIGNRCRISNVFAGSCVPTGGTSNRANHQQIVGDSLSSFKGCTTAGTPESKNASGAEHLRLAISHLNSAGQSDLASLVQLRLIQFSEH